ncbi:hypothetical protein [Algoriphagus aquimarinus]|uniref:Uncharacterized protein n=1 Tax=Algoriphagus aquimarinus TaxID=237018 RepID=A0A1I1ATU4_9BACT|nr:hypothetical protein [Algoriphagus aquimarinus]SFB39733.1 hypothetical protein SAMN04489723_1098 [Algoriphagus aquimarinus]
MSNSNNKTLPISYREAANHVMGMPRALDLGAFGGTFNVNELRVWIQDPNFNGLMFWFCLEAVVNHVFVVVEPRFGKFYNTPDLHSYIPLANELIKPVQILPKNVNGTMLIEDWLKKGGLKVSGANTSIPNSEIVKWVDNFKTTYSSSDLNEFGFTYFINQHKGISYISNLINFKDVHYIRYAFAYDTSCKPNSLRLILFPVGVDGDNIEVQYLEEESGLLQYSWPPKTEEDPT